MLQLGSTMQLSISKYSQPSVSSPCELTKDCRVLYQSEEFHTYGLPLGFYFNRKPFCNSDYNLLR
jgi:hypothetical protein